MAGSGGNSGDFGRWNRDGIDTRGAGVFKTYYFGRDRIEYSFHLFTLVYSKANIFCNRGRSHSAYSARTAHPFQRNGAPFRFKLSKAQQVD